MSFGAGEEADARAEEPGPCVARRGNPGGPRSDTAERQGTRRLLRPLRPPGLRLLARRLRSWSGEPLGPAAEAEALAFPQLRRALSCRLAEIGDFYELADVESARKALNMATAIEAELSFGAPVDVGAVDGVAGTPEDR
jgi:hypothetical protein